MIRSLMHAAAFAVVVASTALAAEVRTYPVPEGAGPHDVAPAPDGKVWYSAQGAGALGILDPASGEVRDVPLGENSAPHGVIQGPDGAAWLTDGGLNAIVRVDPKTEEVKSWPLPEQGERMNGL
jgi:virginiamycin B lyase